ncbi:MAG: C-type lectin domain-containing protein, partial [Phycisphaerae bacterium]
MMSIGRVAKAAACAALTAGVAVAQPVQWRVEGGGNGHWYDTLTWDRVTAWTEARDAATAAGGHLATIQSGSENDFVFALATARPVWTLGGVIGPWIGLHTRRDCLDCYEWVTGEPLGFTNWWVVDTPNCNCRTGVCLWEGTSHWQDMSPNYDGRFGGDGVRSAIVEWSADCNNDGIVDKGQILAGELADANNNGIPDFPAVAVQPQDQASADGGSVSFTVQVATGPACSTPVTYRWQRRNPAVPDPAAPGAWFDLAD